MLRLTSKQQEWALYAGGAAAALGGLYALWPTDPRQRMVAAVTSQLGQKNDAPYWRDTLPAGYPPSGYPPDWCGAFALWGIHQGGMGKDLLWDVGVGFLSKLPQTRTPLPGDVAYFETNQHHAVVTDVGLIGGRIGLVNGNGMGGAVTASSIDPGQAKAFYSIAPLVAHAETIGLVPLALASAVVAGSAAWVLLPAAR